MSAGIAISPTGNVVSMPHPPESFTRMWEKGNRLGIGVSTSLGWFEFKGIDPAAKRMESSEFVRSCTDEEFSYAHGRVLSYDKYDVGMHHYDTLRCVVGIAHSLM